MSVFGSLTWATWVLDDDPLRQGAALAALEREIGIPEVWELLDLCSRGSIEERTAALRLLLYLARGRDPRITGQETWSAWTDALQAILREHYPRLPLGPPALQGLLEADPRAAEEYLVSELDDGAVVEADAPTVARHLWFCHTARSQERLVELSEREGPLGRAAIDVLDAHGACGPERVAALAADWRAAPTAGGLTRLYYAWIEHLPEGTPLEQVVALMGEPQRADSNAVWYEAGGLAAYLELDSKGRLGGRGLD